MFNLKEVFQVDLLCPCCAVVHRRGLFVRLVLHIDLSFFPAKVSGVAILECFMYVVASIILNGQRLAPSCWGFGHAHQKRETSQRGHQRKKT